MVLSIDPPPMLTGWAAPMFVPGAIAATSEARVISTPAEADRAPDGVTYTATGTRDLMIACTICRIAVSRPPGVSSSTTRSEAFSSSARSMTEAR